MPEVLMILPSCSGHWLIDTNGKPPLKGANRMEWEQFCIVLHVSCLFYYQSENGRHVCIITSLRKVPTVSQVKKDFSHCLSMEMRCGPPLLMVTGQCHPTWHPLVTPRRAMCIACSEVSAQDGNGEDHWMQTVQMRCTKMLKVMKQLDRTCGSLILVFGLFCFCQWCWHGWNVLEERTVLTISVLTHLDQGTCLFCNDAGFKYVWSFTPIFCKSFHSGWYFLMFFQHPQWYFRLKSFDLEIWMENSRSTIFKIRAYCRWIFSPRLRDVNKWHGFRSDWSIDSIGFKFTREIVHQNQVRSRHYT